MSNLNGHFDSLVNNILSQLAAVPADAKSGPSRKDLVVGAGLPEDFAGVVTSLLDHDPRLAAFRAVKGPFGGVRPKVAAVTVPTVTESTETATATAAE